MSLIQSSTESRRHLALHARTIERLSLSSHSLAPVRRSTNPTWPETGKPASKSTARLSDGETSTRLIETSNSPLGAKEDAYAARAPATPAHQHVGATHKANRAVVRCAMRIRVELEGWRRSCASDQDAPRRAVTNFKSTPAVGRQQSRGRFVEVLNVVLVAGNSARDCAVTIGRGQGDAWGNCR